MAAKAEIISFKADGSLLEAMAGVPNRSEFIRRAILVALEDTCPVCAGTGILSPRQKQHWQEFAAGHEMVECRDCHERRLVCLAAGSEPSGASADEAAGQRRGSE